jgi:hypothetical protein
VSLKLYSLDVWQRCWLGSARTCTHARTRTQARKHRKKTTRRSSRERAEGHNEAGGTDGLGCGGVPSDKHFVVRGYVDCDVDTIVHSAHRAGQHESQQAEHAGAPTLISTRLMLLHHTLDAAAPHATADPDLHTLDAATPHATADRCLWSLLTISTCSHTRAAPHHWTKSSDANNLEIDSLIKSCCTTTAAAPLPHVPSSGCHLALLMLCDNGPTRAANDCTDVSMEVPSDHRSTVCSERQNVKKLSNFQYFLDFTCARSGVYDAQKFVVTLCWTCMPDHGR